MVTGALPVRTVVARDHIDRKRLVKRLKRKR